MTVNVNFVSDDENSNEEKCSEKFPMKNRLGIMIMPFVREQL